MENHIISERQLLTRRSAIVVLAIAFHCAIGRPVLGLDL